MSIETPTGTAAETPDPAEDAPEHRRGQSDGWRVRRPLTFVLAVLFFFGPAFAYVLGARPQEIENRRLAALPSVSDGWGFFPAFSTWATDHLPLRKQAVEGNASASERVFGEPPSYGGGGGVAGVPGTTGQGGDAAKADEPKYPPVIQGKDGWLYYGGDVSGPCQPSHTVADTLARLTRLATAVRSSGRTFVLVVAPDKSTVWPQELPAEYLGKSCAAARKTEFWTALRATPPPGYVDLRGPIEAQQRSSGQPLYRQTDTHWGQQGAILYAKAVADALKPGLWSRLTVRSTGDFQRAGDLGVLLGKPHVDTIPGVQLLRPGATTNVTMPSMPLGNPVKVDPGAGASRSLIGTPTLLLGDSFTNSSTGIIPNLFTNLTILHNEAAASRPQVAADAMVKSDAVVYEIVERTVAAGNGALIADPALTAIEATLKAHPR